MCGIAGKFAFERGNIVRRETIDSMLRPIAHRGPDGNGIYLDENVGLGHCRLSIIDLGGGAQPMANEDETVWIVFNGEIYNFEELRRDLIARGHQFRSHCDTEVIIHLYEEYGRECVTHLRGMFAFAVWDSRKRRLFLARDRVGIKPLYYYANRDFLAFGSEVKALLALGEIPREISPDSVEAFWCFNYLPGELTMFRDVRKLLPGYILEVDETGRVETHQYWDLSFAKPEQELSFEAAVEKLTDLLRESVRQHMIADVPVGFLLSGGMDSSAVLTYAAQETQKPISTFTVGFEGEDIVDERPFARLMAQKHGSNHFETTITARQFWDYLPKLMWHLDHPICEPPAVALHYVSELARKHVKVLLSGEGGDEAFGGYPNYPNQLRLDRLRQQLGPLRGLVGAGARVIGRLTGRRRLAEYGRMLPSRVEDYYWSRVGFPDSFRNSAASSEFAPAFRTRLNGGHAGRMALLYSRVNDASLLDRMLYIDSKTWLPDDLLVKADKVTMASSLELRVPLLDHKLLEFAASLPSHHKVRGRETKRILKAAFGQVLPPEIIHRKKVGFPLPYGRWLATELRNEVREVLLGSNSFVSRFFERQVIFDALKEHSGGQRRGREIFALLALEVWQGAHYTESLAV